MKLTNGNINDVVEKIQSFFESVKVPKKDKIRLCMLIEESLLRFQEKFGEDYEFNFVTRKLFGTPRVSIKIKGKPYNPLEDDDEDQLFSEDIMHKLSNYEKATIIYSYNHGYNEISAFASKEIKKFKIPGGYTTIAILLAFVLGFLSKKFLAQDQIDVLYQIVTPVLNNLLGALIAINIPMIFISVVASICAIENVAMLNNLGSKILLRFFKMMFFIAFLSIFVNSLFFNVIEMNLKGDIIAESTVGLKVIFDLILSIIPQNIVDPFDEGKILQVVVLAIITGISVVILGERVSEFKQWIMNLQQIIFKITDIVFKIIPLIIFLCIFKTFLSGSTQGIFSVWKVVAAEYVIYFLMSAGMLLMISIKYGVKISDFVKKISPAFMISFTTGSGSASMPKNMEICKKELNIDKKLCDFYIPLSHAVGQTAKIMGIVTCTFFAAEFSGATISIAQLFVIAFLSVQFALATVSGNGGMIATLTLLFVQLGFSPDAIGPITIADIFVVNLSGVVALIIRDCDLVDLSHQVKLSDEK
ncbi:MAG: cation:dicarboxylase symporter family transporter [Selenomonadaceae bacterium]|nr:cation:dicarboxylase symporter family transporter [Selenomonadaceae bacterium]